MMMVVVVVITAMTTKLDGNTNKCIFLMWIIEALLTKSNSFVPYCIMFSRNAFDEFSTHQKQVSAEVLWWAVLHCQVNSQMETSFQIYLCTGHVLALWWVPYPGNRYSACTVPLYITTVFISEEEQQTIPNFLAVNWKCNLMFCVAI